MSQPTAVILGASTNRSKYGNKAVRAHVQAGYKVYPVNPQASEVEGLPACVSLADVPIRSIDRVSVYLPPAVGITLLEEIACLQPQQVWLNPGTSDTSLLAEATSLGLPIIEGCSIIDLGLNPAQFPD